jgi:hypothetical protein
VSDDDAQTEERHKKPPPPPHIVRDTEPLLVVIGIGSMSSWERWRWGIENSMMVIMMIMMMI